MIKVGLIIHGPYCETTDNLTKNAKKVFNKQNIIYVKNDQSKNSSNINGIKVLQAEDPGELIWLGRKGKNLFRHMENVRIGSDYLHKCDYLFKVRSDMNLNKDDFIRLKNKASENCYKLIKVRNYSFYIPFHDLDFIYGGPSNVIKKSSELILFDIDFLFNAFLYNKRRVFRSAGFIFNSEMIIDLALWIAINKISLKDLIRINPLYNYNFIDTKENTIYITINQFRTFPKRLSVLNKWYLKYFLNSYLYPILMRPIDKLIFRLQMRL